VLGTIHKCDYGGAPLIQFNEQRYNQSDIDVPSQLADDVKLIEKAGEIGLFYYGPRLWMLGHIEPLKSLQNDQEKYKIIDRILKVYPIRELTESDTFYRLRQNPEKPYSVSEYDAAPHKKSNWNRLDSNGFSILYGSQDLELCIHECRVSVEDSIYVSKLSSTRTLKLLDLTELIDETGVTEFDSLDIAIHFLFLAGKHSYEICREIALKAYERGLDGIIYPSYFSYIKTGHIPFDTVYGISIRKMPRLKEYAKSQIIPNLALFGRPIKDGKVKVDCINRVLINRVSYDVTFGPVSHKSYSGKTNDKV